MLVVLAVIALALLLVVATAGAVVAVTRDMPSLTALQAHVLAQTTVVYDRTGAVIAQLHGATDRLIVPSSRIPQAMKDATVATEDRRFYEHHGVDFVAVARALVADLKAGHIVQGGSTITEQYVKNA